MSGDAIAAVGQVSGEVTAVNRNLGLDRADNGLYAWAAAQIDEVDGAIRNAEVSMQSLIVGKAENLHEVMLDIEKARISLDLTVQIRNRLVEAYQEVMRMQI